MSAVERDAASEAVGHGVNSEVLLHGARCAIDMASAHPGRV